MRKDRPDRDREEREFIQAVAPRGKAISDALDDISRRMLPYKQRYEVVSYTFNRKSLLPAGRKVFDLSKMIRLNFTAHSRKGHMMFYGFCLFGFLGFCDGLVSYHEPLRFYMYTIYPNIMRWHDGLPTRDVTEFRTDLLTLRRQVQELFKGSLEERERKELQAIELKLMKLEEFDKHDQTFREQIAKIQDELDQKFVEQAKEIASIKRQAMLKKKVEEGQKPSL